MDLDVIGYDTAPHLTFQQRAERQHHRLLEAVAIQQEIMDSYQDAGLYVPDAVTLDYEAAVERALAFAQYFGFDTLLDC